MRVIGIDPGSITSGYGIVEERAGQLEVVEYGVMHIAQTVPLPQRLLFINQRLIELIQQYAPHEFAIEDVFVAKNAKSSLKLGHIRGALMLTAAQAGVSIAEYSALQVKQAVVGYGRAEKAQVQQMVKVLLRLRDLPRPEDAADALAVAICHHHSAKLNRQLAQARQG